MSKAKYRVVNWAEYDKALVNRGNVTIWFDKDEAEEKWQVKKTGKKGGQFLYTDEAIEMLLIVKSVFSLPYRMLEGFSRSMMARMQINLPIPDHTTLSRRSSKVECPVIARPTKERIHLVVDSTGVKIYGEGEWKIHKHGAGKRRSWIKVHLGVDADQKDVHGVVVTTEETHDCEVFEELVDQVVGDIEAIYGDGAYDTRKAYEVAEKRNARLVVPPREKAVFWEEGHPRNIAILMVILVGMAMWKVLSGYHKPSIAENAMYRFKQLFGDSLSARKFKTQQTEVRARLSAMNTMTYLGMPVSVRRSLNPS